MTMITPERPDDKSKTAGIPNWSANGGDEGPKSDRLAVISGAYPAHIPPSGGDSRPGDPDRYVLIVPERADAEHLGGSDREVFCIEHPPDPQIYRDRLVGILIPGESAPLSGIADTIAGVAHKQADSVSIVALEDYVPGELRAWLDDHDGIDGLKRRIDDARSYEPRPSRNGDGDDPLPEFRNFVTKGRKKPDPDGKNGETITVYERDPLSMSEIEAMLGGIAYGWPKRVDDRLFVPTEDHEPVWLDSPDHLFAWIDRRARVDWSKGTKFVTQGRFFRDRSMLADPYKAIESLPHFPPLPGIYYMHRRLPGAAGKLDGLLDHFRPHTAADRELIKAFILTLFWGGEPGKRPSFLFTGPDHDPLQGREIGKTILPQVIADELGNGHILVSPNEEMADIKRRILSGMMTLPRVIMLDNVKTLKFSWAEYEATVTDSIISGHALYHGERQRPNTITWVITINGASLSSDIALRVIKVVLKRFDKAESSGWLDRLKDYIRVNRWELIAEIGAILSEPTDPPDKIRTRFAEWESGVLSHVVAPAAVADLIRSRSQAVNEGTVDADLVRECIHQNIANLGYKPDEVNLLIPSAIGAGWISDAMRKSYATPDATNFVKSLSIDEITIPTESLYSSAWKTNKRCWAWRGKDAPDRALKDHEGIPLP